jgi:hypothetical protein
LFDSSRSPAITRYWTLILFGYVLLLNLTLLFSGQGCWRCEGLGRRSGVFDLGLDWRRGGKWLSGFVLRFERNRKNFWNDGNGFAFRVCFDFGGW